MSAPTTVATVVVPEVFTPYVQQRTTELSAVIASGAMVANETLSGFLAGGGLTVNVPSFKDLEADDSDDADLPADDTAGAATPRGIGAGQEIAARLSRSQGWKASDLSTALAGADPMAAIGDLVSGYWSRRLQKAVVATIKGVFADNAAAPTGGDTHTQDDMTNDISGVAFSNGVTNFSAEAFIDATQTMGDAAGALAIVLLHSVVYARMKKNNLIDFVPDSEGRLVIPTFLGLRVVADDGVPTPSSGVYETWIAGAGALLFGQNTPKVATETIRVPAANNGSGEEQLWNRTEWAIHPRGHQYIQGTIPIGGPTNTNLATAANWSRIYPERKQIAIARLVTREF